jgi:peptidoglycan/xylan/chitin deacetylase (PgdA/CDA1 family)
MAQKHEVASHGYQHGSLLEGDLAKSKATLEEITGKEIRGFRRARMAATDQGPIVAAGYGYNTSENPTWIPGRYNNFFKTRTPYQKDGLINIPASVTPVIRFPLFWLSFKNFPLWMIKAATRRVLARDGAVNLYYHPWEFAPLDQYRMPGYVKRLAGRPLVDKLDEYVQWLKGEGRFGTFGEYERELRKKGL